MTKRVQLPGELSYYLVDLQTQTVKQVKTNRWTGRSYTAVLANKAKAEMILKMAAD